MAPLQGLVLEAVSVLETKMSEPPTGNWCTAMSGADTALKHLVREKFSLF